MLDKALLQKTLQTLGLKALHAHQEEFIQSLMDRPLPGKGALGHLVILPTGAGKTLCFQVPALLFPGLTLVVYPLLSLMADQERRFKAGGLGTAVLRGGQTREQRKQLWQKLSTGQVKILLTNPECLIRPEIRQQLEKITIDHVVLDEAHCVSQWGREFRPAYRELGPLLSSLKARRISAFTATAGREIIQDLEDQIFSGDPYHLLKGSLDRKNLLFSVRPSLSPLLSILQVARQIPEPILIFRNRRDSCERLVHQLGPLLKGRQLAYYHAGLSKTRKEALEDWFFQSPGGILVATKAYGMGVDKQNIRVVIHPELPTDWESYLQEAGRAGRDGRPSFAILLRPERIPAGSTPVGSLKHYLHQQETCRRTLLLAPFQQEAGECSGCDVCQGQTLAEPPEKPQLHQWLKPLLKRFGTMEIYAFLKGLSLPGQNLLFWKHWPGYGQGRTWSLDLVQELLLGLKKWGKGKRTR